MNRFTVSGEVQRIDKEKSLIEIQSLSDLIIINIPFNLFENTDIKVKDFVYTEGYITWSDKNVLIANKIVVLQKKKRSS